LLILKMKFIFVVVVAMVGVTNAANNDGSGTCMAHVSSSCNDLGNLRIFKESKIIFNQLNYTVKKLYFIKI
jgi:hypothetical protein